MYLSRIALSLLFIGTSVTTSVRSLAQDTAGPLADYLQRTQSAGSNLYIDALTFARLSANQLGIEVTAAEGALKAQLGIEGGLVVTKAPEGSEGAKAGLQAHDVILNINAPRSEPVRDIEKLNAILTENAGKKIEIGLLRGGKMQLLGIEVPVRQDLAIQAIAPGFYGDLTQFVFEPEQYRIGVSLSEADETLRTQLQLPAGEGLVVTEVLAGTAAEKAEIKQHDVLVELEEKHLANVEQINKQIQEIKSRPVKLKLVRCGKTVTVEVTPEKIAAPQTSAIAPAMERRAIFIAPRMSGVPSGWEVQLVPSVTTTYAYTDLITNINQIDNSPRKQLEVLKTQLAEMQKAVVALDNLLPAEQKQNSASAQQQAPSAEQKQNPAVEEKK